MHNFVSTNKAIIRIRTNKTKNGGWVDPYIWHRQGKAWLAHLSVLPTTMVQKMCAASNFCWVSLPSQQKPDWWVAVPRDHMTSGPNRIGLIPLSELWQVQFYDRGRNGYRPHATMTPYLKYELLQALTKHTSHCILTPLTRKWCSKAFQHEDFITYLKLNVLFFFNTGASRHTLTYVVATHILCWNSNFVIVEAVVQDNKFSLVGGFLVLQTIVHAPTSIIYAPGSACKGGELVGAPFWKLPPALNTPLCH